MARARAALERAENDLRNSTIVCPMDGLVLSRDVEVGDAVSSILVLGSQATLMMTLGDVGERLRARQGGRGRHRQGLPRPARAHRGRVLQGQEVRGQGHQDLAARREKDNVTTFEVRVSIHNPGGELKANMSANAEIILEEKKGVLLVPEAAVLYDKDRSRRSRCRTRRRRPASARWRSSSASRNGVKTELLEGLKEGDKVVLQ